MEKFIEVLSWLKIAASPSIIGIVIGFVFLNVIENENLGQFLFGFFTIAGIIIGILFANRMSKKYGASDFVSRANASPDIDEAIKNKKL